MTRVDGVRAARLGLAINAILGLTKITVGAVTGSVAVIADGLHSLVDLAGSTAVWLGMLVAGRPADDGHPYGHLKAESVAAKIVALLVMAAGLNIVILSTGRLLGGQGSAPGPAALYVTGASIIIKEWLYRHQSRIAARLSSSALHASAWEQRSDALSSVVVFVGVGASMAGVRSADAVAALAVGLVIIRIGWLLLGRAVNELMDCSVGTELIGIMEHAALSVDGVKGVNGIRTRRAGPGLFVDLSIIVDGDMTVAAGHRLSERVEQALREEFDQGIDAVVHVEPPQAADRRS